MKALIWKDWHLVRPVLIAAAVLYVSPFVIYAVGSLFGGYRLPESRFEFFSGAGQLLVLGLVASLLAAPAFSGVIFARERRDRTAEFASTLPIPRVRLVLSKAIVTLAVTILPWLLTLALLLLNSGLGGPSITDRDSAPILSAYLIPVGITVMNVGLGWLLSASLRSETLASALAFFFTCLTLITTMYAMDRLELKSNQLTWPYWLIPLVAGTLAAGAGTLVALRRPTP